METCKQTAELKRTLIKIGQQVMINVTEWAGLFASNS